MLPCDLGIKVVLKLTVVPVETLFFSLCRADSAVHGLSPMTDFIKRLNLAT